MRQNTSQVTTILTALLLAPINAWWGTAHMIVARIAENDLAANNPDVLESVLKVLKQSTFSQYLHQEGNYPLVESATFAD